MARCSNKSISGLLTPNVPLQDANDNNDKHLALLERIIHLATEGFTRRKFCELAWKIGIGYQRKYVDNMRLYLSDEKRDKPKIKLQEKHHSISLYQKL
jgi:hypothetical protein